MFGTAVIVFREVFEAGLAIGIVAAALGHAPKALRYIWGGVLVGVLASMVVAVFAGGIANLFGGFGQELLNATILILAVVRNLNRELRRGPDAGVNPRGLAASGRASRRARLPRRAVR